MFTIPRRVIGPRYVVTSKGTVIPVGPPTLQAKASELITKVSFVAPKDWQREDGDGKSVTFDGPADASGAAATIRVEVIDGPDNPSQLYEELLKHQSQPAFKLIDGGVIDRERGLKAAHLRYTCEPEGAEVAVWEMAFTVGFRSVGYAQAICPSTLMAPCDATIQAFFSSLKPARRLELPGSIGSGL